MSGPGWPSLLTDWHKNWRFLSSLVIFGLVVAEKLKKYCQIRGQGGLLGSQISLINTNLVEYLLLVKFRQKLF